MIQAHGVFFPDGETHLIEWMNKVGHTIDGRGTYQFTKYAKALSFVPAARRRVALDCGAHIGQWSWVMARDFARVEAFEPVPRYAECWQANMAGVANARLHPIALGDHRGLVSMHAGTPGSHGDTFVARPEDAANAAADVELCPLDYWLGRAELGDAAAHVDFVKVDNEGYEYFALRGGEEMLKRCRPVVIVEQKPGMAQKYGLRELQAVEYLESLGAVRRAAMAGDFVLSW